MDRPLLKAGKE